MKRSMLILLAVLMLLLAPATQLRANAAETGTCGENLTWTLDDAGTLTISGTGAMDNYTAEMELPWYSQREAIQSVVVEDGVTTIGDYAFYDYSNLSSVTIGKDVTSIGFRAFQSCESLVSITIPGNVTTIERAAFNNCSNLSSVTFGDGVTTIGDESFTFCTSLTSITFPDSVTTIDDWAFMNCENLSSVTFGKGVTFIGEWAFCECNLDSITIPDSVTTIVGTAFQNCRNLRSVTLGKGITTIEVGTFMNCASLSSITIPDNVTIIDEWAFYGCTSLSDIIIPKSVTTIGEWAFSNCTGLTEIHYAGTEEEKAEISIAANNSDLENAQWHYECDGTNCPALPPVEKSGTCGDNLTWILDDAGTLTISGTGAMYDYTYEIDNVSSIISTAPWYSYRENIQSVVLEDGVTSIGNWAFASCENLSEITIPDSVTSIGKNAFYLCAALNVVHYGGTEAQRAEITIGSENSYLENAQWHYECDGTNCPALPPVEKSGTCGDNLTWILDDEGILTISGTGAMYDYGYESNDIPSDRTAPWYSYRESIRSVVLEDGATTIGDHAFFRCSNLDSIIIPNSVTSIGVSAFARCTSLTSISIPDSITSIDTSTFADCTSLTSISIPNSVTSIGVSAFARCTSLTSISIPNSVTNIGVSAFTYCTGLSSITIPTSVTIIRQGVFRGCISLTDIIIPDSVNIIEGYAFSDCFGLSSITIPTSVTSIGRNAFYIYGTLNVVHYGGTEEEKAAISIADGNSDLENAQWHYECDGTNCPALPPVDKSGTCGDNLTWILDDAGTLTISGTGAMYDYTYEGDKISSKSTAPWYSYRENIQSVVLEDGVTTIGEYAFDSCSSLDSITIPNTVTAIGYGAFSDCTSLSSISIPDSVTSIGGAVFANCTSLTSITIPDSITIIGASLFADCTSLSSITLPDSITIIDSGAFCGCTSLSSITIPNRVTGITEGVFSNCTSLSSISIPNGVVFISYGAFYNCTSLSSIIIPESVTTIDDSVFYNCTALSVVHYGGTEAQRAEISIRSKNSDLENAQWHYECDGTNCPALPPMDSPFVDIAEGAYYFDPVLWAVEKGITSGLDATHFGPNATCTRAQVVTFLWRASGCPQPQNTDNPFSDVNSGDFFYTAVLWAAEKGITAGTGNGTFDPHAECTRGQVATFLWRAQGSPASGGSNSFTDVAPGAYYYDAVLWAVENGITTGLDATHFGPNAACSRGQIVTFLYRAMN